VEPDESPTELPGQLPLWADEAPEEALPLLDTIDRLRTLMPIFVSSTHQDVATANALRSLLERQFGAMATMGADFDEAEPIALLPDFTGDDCSSLEAVLLTLVRTNAEELAEAEQIVEAASADPENRKLVARISERLPSRAQAVKLGPWALLVVVSLDLLKVAPELNPNDINVLAMILMVALYLLPPRSGS